MYERPINPPEPVLEDVTVEVDGFAYDEEISLPTISGIIGGDAFWQSEKDFEGMRNFLATTVVTDCESYEVAEDIVHNLLVEHGASVVDLDNIAVNAQRIEPRAEYDW